MKLLDIFPDTEACSIIAADRCRAVKQFSGRIIEHCEIPPQYDEMQTDVGKEEVIMEDENRLSEDDFRTRARERLLNEHPDLVERWLPHLDDPDPGGRLLGYTAVWTCMDVIDAKKRAKEAMAIND